MARLLVVGDEVVNRKTNTTHIITGIYFGLYELDHQKGVYYSRLDLRLASRY